MELRVNEVKTPEKITFNYEELRSEIQKIVEDHSNLVYTGEQIKDAKSDKSSLNKLKKALNDERIRLEKAYLEPFNEFKTQINALIKLINDPINLIDKQIKEFEEYEKQEKRKQIEELWNSKSTPFEISLECIFDSRWLNKTTSMRSIEDVMNAFITSVEKDVDTLSRLPEFGFEALEVYKSTLDINRALSEGQRLAEIQKKKAEHEAEQARLKAEKEAKKAAEFQKKEEDLPGQIGFTDAKSFEECMNPPETEMAKCVTGIEKEVFEECVARERQWVSFQANLTTEDALALKAFFNSRNIEFKAI